MQYAIETYDLSKRFQHQRGLLGLFQRSKKAEETIAVDKVNIKVEEGEVFGLLGHNGAGKTTLIKLLCTAIIPSSGTAKIHGYDITREGNHVRNLIGLVSSDERSFFWRLTGKENLIFFASLYKIPKKESEKRINNLLELFDLREAANIRFNEYSTGMKQKLGIARGLLNKPSILFLDEPTKGLDPASAHILRNLIKERVVRHLGNSVIVTTHILSEVEHLCNKIAVMNYGKIVASGSIEDIKSSFQKYEKYHLQIENLSDVDIDEIARMENIISYSRLFSTDGVIDIEISLLKNTKKISDILKFILQNNGKIRKCALIEPTFEEVFQSIVENKDNMIFQ